MRTTPSKLGIASRYCIVSDPVFSRQWEIYLGLLYDLTDYIYTLKQQSDVDILGVDPKLDPEPLLFKSCILVYMSLRGT